MNELDLFSEKAMPAIPYEDASPGDFGKRVERSALWAAYGDALGWISELTDTAGLLRRTGGEPLNKPIAWKRRIGGRSGVVASLPQGCYSDDSQLRLATSRAIRSDGFDVEAFAKVELPVWLSYGLGGGKGTSAAATQLVRQKSIWWSNQFKGWTHSGGNGAAMRIQPHVWATQSLEDPESYLPDVVRNAVCTHSHPTGLMGAVLHAQCVAQATKSGLIPSPDDLYDAIQVAGRLPAIIEHDTELGYWRAAFEQEAGDFDKAWDRAASEAREAVKLICSSMADKAGEERYRTIIDTLQLREAKRRGSGILTALAATALAWCESRPEEAMRIAANSIGTDTDTIATMAGAVIGATADALPPVDVLDAKVFLTEARRMSAIASGGNPPSHPYPDLLHWSAPKTRADALVHSDDGGLVVRGLGQADKLVEEPVVSKSGDFRWQWIKLEFGQTLLIKRRDHLLNIKEAQGSDTGGEIESRMKYHLEDSDSPDTPRTKSQIEDDEAPNQDETHDVQDVVSYVEKHINEDLVVGRALRRVVHKGTMGEIAAFNAALIDLLRRSPPRPGKPNKVHDQDVKSNR